MLPIGSVVMGNRCVDDQVDLTWGQAGMLQAIVDRSPRQIDGELVRRRHAAVADSAHALQREQSRPCASRHDLGCGHHLLWQVQTETLDDDRRVHRDSAASKLANCRIVGNSKTVAGVKRSPACSASATNSSVAMDAPPNSKKLSSMPTRCNPRIPLMISASLCSIGSRGGVDGVTLIGS